MIFRFVWYKSKIHDSIRPFRVYQPFTSASDGTVTYESDYLHIVGSPYLVYGSTVTPITFILEDEFVSTLTNQLRPVNAGNPIARDISNGFGGNIPTTSSSRRLYLHKKTCYACIKVIYK